MKLREEKGKISTIFNIILVIIAIIAIYYVWHIYRINEFGNFVKAEYTTGISQFTRDNSVKYSDQYSYKIESQEFNDALIYRNIDVKENTLYRVTAMVKFENVQNEKEESEGGVNIGIMDTTEKSNSLVGNGDWQSLVFQFDSRNRTNVDITFRLGAYDDNSKGTVWFSDFKLDEVKKDENNNWNFICLIMKNLQVDIEKDGNKTKTNLNLKPSEISLIENNMKRFQTSMKEMSGGRMTVTYRTIVVDKPITSISYSDDYGNYIATTNIEEILERYVDNGGIEYDHIFVAYKLGEDLHEERIKTGDWIGLGGMTYKKDIGFSNIRIPNENADLLYNYSNFNTFPEEVFIHEFLHNLERIENECKNEIPELHSYEKYGYVEDDTEGLKKWYIDYMTSNINNKNIGLSKEVFSMKPVHDSYFKTSIDLTEEKFHEPENLGEHIKALIEKIKGYFIEEENI